MWTGAKQKKKENEITIMHERNNNVARLYLNFCNKFIAFIFMSI